MLQQPRLGRVPWQPLGGRGQPPGQTPARRVRQWRCGTEQLTGPPHRTVSASGSSPGRGVRPAPGEAAPIREERSSPDRGGRASRPCDRPLTAVKGIRCPRAAAPGRWPPASSAPATAAGRWSGTSKPLPSRGGCGSSASAACSAAAKPSAAGRPGCPSAARPRRRDERRCRIDRYHDRWHRIAPRRRPARTPRRALRTISRAGSWRLPGTTRPR